MQITVVGLGKIGLPLACQIASSGFNVVGYDVNEIVVSKVNSGIAPFPNEPGLEEKLISFTSSDRLLATTDCEVAFSDAEVIVICVPLLIDGSHHEPDFSILDSVCKEIGSFATGDVLVILETTVPVGTTRNRIAKLIDLASKSQRRTTRFDVAFSPERISSGTVFADLRRYPKIVGGVCERAGTRAEEFYKSCLSFDQRLDLPKPNGVWRVSSSEAAEMIKLAETTFRDVNIALANEFAEDCLRLGLSFQEVRAAANSQPFSNIHQAGVSVGGHCIPVYPHLYLKSGSASRLIPTARVVNDSMPSFTAALLQEQLGTLMGKNVLIAGISYRPLVRETAFTGAFPLREQLENKGATVFAIDPLYSEDELIELGMQPLRRADLVDAIIVHTHHPSFETWTKEDFPGCSLVLEGRPGPLVKTLNRHFDVRPLFS